MTGIIAALGFAAGLALLARFLRRRDERGYWDKEGFARDRPHRGIHYRPLEVPPRPPFD